MAVVIPSSKVSVISRFICSGFTLYFFSVLMTLSARFAWMQSTTDKLTSMYSSPRFKTSEVERSSQTDDRTKLSMAITEPFLSAIGINTAGEINPSCGSRSLNSASQERNFFSLGL